MKCQRCDFMHLNCACHENHARTRLNDLIRMWTKAEPVGVQVEWEGTSQASGWATSPFDGMGAN